MADSSVSCSLSWLNNPVNFIKLINSKSIDFEQIYTCITPEAINGVARGIKQLIYWREKLQHLVSHEMIILTCITSQGLSRPNINQLKVQINSLIGTGQIACIYYPENTNFVGLAFKTTGAAKLVRQRVADIGGAPVCFVPEKDINEFSIRILWTPINCPLELINSSLNNYCSKVDITYEKMVFQDGDIVPSNMILGTIVLKDNISLSTLPHILKINWIHDRHLLLIVKGRPPLCLRCRLTGHIRKNCPERKCNLCNISHPTADKCPEKSYASVTMTSSLTKHDDIIVNEGVDYPEENNKLPPVIKPSHSKYDTSSVISSDQEFSFTSQVFDTNLMTQQRTKRRKTSILSEKDHQSSISSQSSDKVITNIHSDHLLSSETSTSAHGLSSINLDSNISNTLNSTIIYSSEVSLPNITNNTDTSTSSIFHIVPSEPMDTTNSSSSQITLPSDTEIDPEFNRSISGFSKHTSRSAVRSVLGSPSPISVWHYLNSEGHFEGIFGATFSTKQDIELQLDKKNLTYKGKNITLTPFHLSQNNNITTPDHTSVLD